MALSMLFILQSKAQHTLSTLGYKTSAIGAYFKKIGDQFTLKLALNMKEENDVKAFGTNQIQSLSLLNSLMRNLG
jgi:hypothetical protein